MLRRIVILALPDSQPLDVVGPYEVFAGARHAQEARGARDLGYQPLIAALDQGPLRGEHGFEFSPHVTLASVARPSAPPIDTFMVAGGLGARTRAHDPRLVKLVQRTAARARRVASVCTGAFVLAAAGLLDGRRATTHWQYCKSLAERHPAISIEPDPIYVRDGNVWTSAGVTAGMDMALAMVEHDLGHALAATLSRHYVMFIRRSGGQSQFSPHLRVVETDHEKLRELLSFISEHIEDALDVPSLAKRAGMSVRNFSRRFRAETGETPATYIERVRIEHARKLLEDTQQGIDEIATRSGFGHAETLRRAFARRIGLSPSEYRGRFGAARAETNA